MFKSIIMKILTINLSEIHINAFFFNLFTNKKGAFPL